MDCAVLAMSDGNNIAPVEYAPVISFYRAGLCANVVSVSSENTATSSELQLSCVAEDARVHKRHHPSFNQVLNV